MGEPTSAACPSTEEAPAAATASDNEFISLVKLAARALFCDLPVGSAGKTTYVLDALTSHEWVRQKDLSQELKMNGKHLNPILKFLQEENLIQIETPAKIKRKKGPMAVDAQELIIHPNSYCSLDYAKVYEFVKHQINMMTENLRNDLTSQNLVQEYICIQCERGRYSAFDAQYLVSTIDDNFHCETCDKNLQPVDGEGRHTISLGKLKKMKLKKTWSTDSGRLIMKLKPVSHSQPDEELSALVEDLNPLLLSIERLKGIAAPTTVSLQQWRNNAQNSLVPLTTVRPFVPPAMASKGVPLKSSQLTMKLKELPLWMIREGGVDLTDDQRNKVNEYVRDVEAKNYKTG